MTILAVSMVHLGGIQTAHAGEGGATEARGTTPSFRSLLATTGSSFSGLSLYTLAGGAAGSAMAYPKDSEIQAWWQDRRPPQKVIQTADLLGDYELQVPALLVFWGATRLAGIESLAQTGTALIEGFAVSKAMTMALKHGVGRRRPD
ncbi:MAG: hypothetical protein QGI83_18530, partial [Candidatus Latescibacteria bacterium]|nr:hypothetical protein [Candidatus Latescibacterota bacterium]